MTVPEASDEEENFSYLQTEVSFIFSWLDRIDGLLFSDIEFSRSTSTVTLEGRLERILQWCSQHRELPSDNASTNPPPTQSVDIPNPPPQSNPSPNSLPTTSSQPLPPNQASTPYFNIIHNEINELYQLVEGSQATGTPIRQLHQLQDRMKEGLKRMKRGSLREMCEEKETAKDMCSDPVSSGKEELEFVKLRQSNQQLQQSHQQLQQSNQQLQSKYSSTQQQLHQLEQSYQQLEQSHYEILKLHSFSLQSNRPQSSTVPDFKPLKELLLELGFSGEFSNNTIMEETARCVRSALLAINEEKVEEVNQCRSYCI